MLLRLLRRKSFRNVVLSMGLLALGASGAYGQYGWRYRRPFYSPPQPCPCPAPEIQQPPTVPPGEEKEKPPEKKAPAEEQPSPEPSLDQLGEQAGAGAGESAGIGSPNMFGDLLFGSRSVRYGFIRAESFVNVAGQGATSLTNPAVADDNSPDPRDRVSFRYNFFSDAQSVTGFGSPVGQTATNPGTAPPVTRLYDVDLYTFTFEKTFCDQLMSLETRIPFSTGVSSHLNVRAGRITGSSTSTFNGAPFTIFDIVNTPQDTLGTTNTEFGNMMFILKGKFYQSCTTLWSGGLSVGAPTGPDEKVQVVDFGGPAATGANHERFRDFHINNETWSLSPFIAVLVTPTPRWFTQGFIQFDFPANSSHFSYSDHAIDTSGAPVTFTGPPDPGSRPIPFVVGGDIREQMLMHIDLGTGYRLLDDPHAKWITGIAPTLELHYTTTLDKAEIVTLPGDFSTVFPNPAMPVGHQIPEPRPQIGNLRNHVDILDMTVGTTFYLGDRATLALGVAFPLKTGDDRVFDWEALVQFNYYFGCRGSGARAAPNILGGS
jgi:hypothetical protein